MATPKKIVILGGGIAALTAAFELTNRPNWQDDYSITIYQMGWRLGGKGASGRNVTNHARIEEHGLHVWGGFYDNSFRLIQKCYDSLNRPPACPIRTWDQAFMPQENFYIIQKDDQGNWLPWHFDIPNRDSQPGNPENPDQPEPPHSFWDFLEEFMEWLQQHLEKYSPLSVHNTIIEKWGDRLKELGVLPFSNLETERDKLIGTAVKIIQRLNPKETADNDGTVHKIESKLSDELTDKGAEVLADILNSLRKLFYDSIKEKLAIDWMLKRAWILADYGISMMVGVLADKLYREPFDSINNLTHVQWLAQNGADDITLQSGLLKALHDIMFAYKDGQLNIEAGTALRSMFRMVRYRGAAIYRMAAGMGDVIFAPLYEALDQRGVDIKFFHIVREIIPDPDPDKKQIQEILIGVQATISKDVKDGRYTPTFNVKGLPCWPSTPFYDQLEQGTELEEQQINLEDYNAPWKDIYQIPLVAGKDFDIAILGISLGSFPDVCSEILKTNEAWATMHNNVLTTPTQSAQLWLEPTLEGLGWTEPGPPFVGAVPDTTMDTYADMTHLIEMEDWPDGDVGDIAYFAGVLPIDTPANDALNDAQDNMKAVLKTIKKLWPDANNFKISEALPWYELVAKTGVRGVERFYDQYFRGNVLGSERYVLTVAGSTQYRLEGDKSGYDNLYLAGDWTKNGYNLGMIESAVMSGMLTSQAISGYPKGISGLGDWY